MVSNINRQLQGHKDDMVSIKDIDFDGVYCYSCFLACFELCTRSLHACKYDSAASNHSREGGSNALVG